MEAEVVLMSEAAAASGAVAEVTLAPITERSRHVWKLADESSVLDALGSFIHDQVI